MSFFLLLPCMVRCARVDLEFTNGIIELSTLSAGGAALVAASSDSLEVLLVGRVLYGLGIGFAMHAAPAYIAGK